MLRRGGGRRRRAFVWWDGGLHVCCCGRVDVGKRGRRRSATLQMGGVHARTHACRAKQGTDSRGHSSYLQGDRDRARQIDGFFKKRERQQRKRTWLRSRSAAALASASLRLASPSLPPGGARPFPLPLPLRRHVPYYCGVLDCVGGLSDARIRV